MPPLSITFPKAAFNSLSFSLVDRYSNYLSCPVLEFYPRVRYGLSDELLSMNFGQLRPLREWLTTASFHYFNLNKALPASSKIRGRIEINVVSFSPNSSGKYKNQDE